MERSYSGSKENIGKRSSRYMDRLNRGKERVTKELYDIIIDIMKGRDIADRRLSRLSSQEVVVYNKLVEVIQSATNRIDSRFKAALSALKRHIRKDMRRDKEFKSTNPKFYVKSNQMNYSLLKSIAPDIEQERLKSLANIWCKSSLPIEEWFDRITMDRTDSRIVDRMIHILKDPTDTIIPTYFNDKVKPYLDKLLLDVDDDRCTRYKTCDEVLDRLSNVHIYKQSVNTNLDTRVKFPLTLHQLKDAILLAIRKIEKYMSSS